MLIRWALQLGLVVVFHSQRHRDKLMFLLFDDVQNQPLARNPCSQQFRFASPCLKILLTIEKETSNTFWT